MSSRQFIALLHLACEGPGRTVLAIQALPLDRHLGNG